MSEGFYRAFEDLHRGSRKLIKERQRVYAPFINPLQAHYGHAPAIDLGCGRGEWLELLTEAGFDAQGVDLDDGMLQECRTRGLKVTTGDAIAALRALPDSSQAVVSGFHLVEHIPFDMVQELVAQALRVLMPAGVLILETPNPENIVVGTANFYLDPTHRQPIPPLLLSFVPQYAGFERVKVLRLQGPVDMRTNPVLTIHDVLAGVSPDYAVVAQKAVPAALFRSVSAAFDVEYGVTLDMLSGGYDQQVNLKIQKAEIAALQAHEKIQQSEIRLAAAIDRAMETATQARHQADVALQNADNATARADIAIARADNATARAQFAEDALNAIYHSTSWNVTAPLRWVGHQHKLLRERGVSGRLRDLCKKIARPILARGIAYFDARPALRARHSGVGGKVRLYDRLRNTYLRIAIDDRAPSATSDTMVSEDSGYAPELTCTQPGAHAKAIYTELKSALEQSGRGD